MTRISRGGFAMPASRRLTDVRRTALVAAFGLIATLLALVPATPASAFAKDVTDVSPDVSDNTNANAATGGRVNGLASVAGDNQMYYAASEWGGLFKSTDGGDSWFHLDKHLPMAMWEVSVDPGNTGTVYATSFYDGRITTEAGINVSYDGGATWNHPASANPAPGDSCTGGVNDEPSAFGISIDPATPSRVAIGTNCGVALSTDSGVNWTFTDPDPAGDPNGGSENVWDVVVRGNTIDACGDDGYYRSSDGGSIYVRATSAPPSGLCELDISPDDGQDVFAAAPATGGGTSIWETNDGNVTWTDHGDPEGTRGGRIHFLRVNDRPGTAFDVWFGEFSLWRAGCDSANTPSCPNAPYPGGFTQNVNSPGQAHDDAGDLVFDTQPAVADDACPRIFSSDGGVHRVTGGCQSPTFVRDNNGMHALWLWGMSGADDPGAGEFLYGGAQDTGSFGTSNADNDPPTWTNPNCCDVFDFISDPTRALFTFCCAGGTGPRTTLNQGAPGLTSQSGVTIPPSGLLPEFTSGDIFDQFGTDDYVILTRDCTFPAPATGSSRGCPATNDGGVHITTAFSGAPTWTELGNASEPPSANLCKVQASVSAGTPTFYAQTGGCDSRGGDQLWKYSGTAPGGTWQRIDNNTGFQGNVGIFAVDPNNPNRLYASDDAAANPTRMVFSNDGGLNWSPDTELDNMMTGGGAFKMDTAIGPTDFEGFGGYTQPTLVAFDPDNGNNIVAGGHDSGVFMSSNGGESWILLTDPFTSDTSGTEHLPQPRFAYFDHETGSLDIYVGTQGRGFWRLTPAIADLIVTKSDHPDPATAGDQLFYDITVENDGPDDAPNVIVTDDLPEEVDFVTSTGSCTETPAGSGNLTCPIGDIANGESITFTIKVAVHADVVSENNGPKTITNRASASSDGAADPNADDNAAVEQTIIDDSADLEITKVCEADASPVAGDDIDCTVFVDNHGPSFAREVVVDDVMDSSGPFLVSSGPTPSQGTCSASAPAGAPHQEFSCQLGDLEPQTSGTTGRATIEYTITASEGQEITNVATVRSDTPDPNADNNRVERSITIESSSDLEVTKSDDPDPVTAGEDLTYTIVATNDGPSAANDVLIEDFAPAGVTIKSVTGSGGPATCNAGVPGDPFRPSTCAFGTLSSGQFVTMTLVVTVLPDTRGQLNNDARVTSSTFDPSNQNNFDTESTQVQAIADLVLTKVDSPDPVVAGTPLDYTFTIKNDGGPSTARDVVVTDDLPQEVVYLSTTISDGSGTCDLVVDNPNNLVLCELQDLDPNEDMTVILHTLVKSDTLEGTITNSADVTSDVSDPDASNDHPVIDTTVETVGDLVVVKNSNQDTYKPSDLIQYTIIVSNKGPSDAQQVEVVDTLPPAKIGYYVFDNQNCGLSGITLTCSLGTIVAGQEKSFNVYFRVKGNKGLIENKAVGTSTGPNATFDPFTSDNTFIRKNLIAGGGKGGGGGGQGNG
ncbi:MAG: hypothetical protein ACRDH9_07645 [Actinomycetota bacterium]